MVGMIRRSKRVFSRHQWESKSVMSAVQDGNQEWITLLATICADGEVLPSGIIFAPANSMIQSTWVKAIKPGKHDVFVTSTPSGWSNNNIGLVWLEQVFDRCTKEKARRRRDYRLLIVDGHGSYVTKDFIDYCHAHHIILGVLPPHSTHMLQPLDIVMFKRLSSTYTKALTTLLQCSLELVPIHKGDFFLLFWEFWKPSFTKPLVLKPFEVTSIWLMD
jgi:hypothetical protein